MWIIILFTIHIPLCFHSLKRHGGFLAAVSDFISLVFVIIFCAKSPLEVLFFNCHSFIPIISVF